MNTTTQNSAGKWKKNILTTIGILYISLGVLSTLALLLMILGSTIVTGAFGGFGTPELIEYAIKSLDQIKLMFLIPASFFLSGIILLAKNNIEHGYLRTVWICFPLVIAICVIFLKNILGMGV